MRTKTAPLVAVLVFSLITLAAPERVLAATILSDNFNSGYSGWMSSGTVTSTSSPAIQPNAVRLQLTGAIWRTVSTVGYTGIGVTWNLAGSVLENPDFCYVEVNTGSGWTSIFSITNGQDDSVYRTGTVTNIAGANDNPNFQIRYRAAGDALGDNCYAEDITVTGTAGPAPTPTPVPSATPIPPATVPGDPLTGSGAVSRIVLTQADLTSGSSTATVDDGAFAMPADAAMPAHYFEGRLDLTGEATGGGFSEIRDDYNYTGIGDSPRKHLPEFSFEFVQNGSHLIPTQQGLTITGHPNWNYLVGPGRAWKENNDGDWSRAAFPFALIQRNSNCTSNGVMTFLFTATSISQVRYQITQETCVYFKFDMWGQLSATYTPGPVANANTLRANHATEVGNRLPTKPIAALATDYPNSGVNVSVFGSGITPAHMTTYGLLFNGTNYVAGCATRKGSYAFCGSMRLPSYSTAKTAMAGLALLRLGQAYGSGVYNLLIKDYVPEYAGTIGTWTSVTFNHAIDMATGNYKMAGYMVDEGGANMETFFLAEPYSDKIAAAFNFGNKTLPGINWVYHTSDTFILARAMNNYLESQRGVGADIFNLLRDEVFTPIKLSSGTMTSLRTDNSATGKAFGGYGMFWTQDDIAKVAKLLNNDNGAAGGIQLLQPAMLADGMQRNPTDRGMTTTSTAGYKYNNGLWAKEFTPADFPQYTCTFYTPFMSGYGGITVAMMPNGATYYYFSDNEEFSWWPATIDEANKLAPHCP